jgi:hypothetical protein
MWTRIISPTSRLRTKDEAVQSIIKCSMSGLPLVARQRGRVGVTYVIENLKILLNYVEIENILDKYNVC